MSLAGVGGEYNQYTLYKTLKDPIKNIDTIIIITTNHIIICSKKGSSYGIQQSKGWNHVWLRMKSKEKEVL